MAAVKRGPWQHGVYGFSQAGPHTITSLNDTIWTYQSYSLCSFWASQVSRSQMLSTLLPGFTISIILLSCLYWHYTLPDKGLTTHVFLCHLSTMLSNLALEKSDLCVTVPLYTAPLFFTFSMVPVTWGQLWSADIDGKAPERRNS